MSVGLIVFLLLVVTHTVIAAPPLVSDDTRTVGKGTLEAIMATSGIGTGDTQLYSLPILDLTIGATDQFDLILIFQPVYVNEEGQDEFTSVPFTAGFKWQFFTTSSSITTSITPTVTHDTRNTSDTMWRLPVQFEYLIGEWRIGTDMNYTIVKTVTDRWRAGIYSGWSVNEKVELLTEVWGSSQDELNLAQYGWSVGIDAAVKELVHFLAAGGTGIYADRGDRFDWHGYVGLRLALPLFDSADTHP